MLETRVHLWCHQDLLRGCVLIIATASIILVSWLACELKQRNNDAALFSGNNLTNFIFIGPCIVKIMEILYITNKMRLVIILNIVNNALHV